MSDTLPPAPRLADRLAQAQRARFVGRARERDLFQRALLRAPDAPAVLFVHGPGGVGKSALLREYARAAADAGRAPILLDGHNFEASPRGFAEALGRACGLPAPMPLPALDGWPPDGVLLIDTYERLAPLDHWLRETLLPRLPAHALAVVAGRNPPDPAWTAGLAWGALCQAAPLGDLTPDESTTFLASRGVPPERHAEALAFTRGHPLALSLVADLLRQSGAQAPFAAPGHPDVVHTLLERFVSETPGPQHRRALLVCASVWAVTESMLAAAVGEAEAPALFDWLAGLSFIERGPHGLYPHDLARDVLDADLRARDPDGVLHVYRRLTPYLHSRYRRAGRLDQQRAWFDLFYMVRHNPAMGPFFDWAAMGSAYAELAVPADHPGILDMVRRHEGEDSARIAAHWLARQPEAFLLYRNLEGEPLGFMAHLRLDRAAPEDCALDPALSPALAAAGGLPAAAPILYLRFWMHKDEYQAVSIALNLTAANCTIQWITEPGLAWCFLAMARPDFMEPHFAGVHIWRAPALDFAVGGRRYGVFAHDWRAEGPDYWLNVKTGLTGLELPVPPAPAPPLSDTEFAEAVRQALRDYAAPDRLSSNPLLRSRLLPEPAPAALQALLREAVLSLDGSPRERKFHLALWHTYIEPAPTQEQAAELLDIPFTTYRYRLAKGIERVIAHLWARAAA